MKRLLCIVGGMNVGGAETFLMKVYRNLDKTQYQMDFAVAIEGEGAYDKEIRKLGGKIYHITPKSKNLVRNFCDIKALVKKEKYEYVLRTSQHSLSALELFAAKLGGAKVRVFRSSNSNTTSRSKKQIFLHRIFRFMPNYFANVRLAPSTEAAEFMFGKGCIDKGRVKIIHNGLDLSVFKFYPEERKQIRKEFSVGDDISLIGHIGRFEEQKNHLFLLEVFKKIHTENTNTKLLLIGKGSLENAVREKAQLLNISDSVIFAGVRSDIPYLLSAMDVFLLPSLYEGMPNTVIEAQATGLPCVIADTITREADITGLVDYVSLKDDISAWSTVAQDFAKKKRYSTSDLLFEERYDILSVVEEFISAIFKKTKET